MGWLRASGVGPGDRVALVLANRSAYLELVFAAARLGAIAVPVTARLAAPEIRWVRHGTYLLQGLPEPLEVFEVGHIAAVLAATVLTLAGWFLVQRWGFHNLYELVPAFALATAAAFGVSALYTGVAGALSALVINFVSPDSFDLFVSIVLLIGVVVGGLASIGSLRTVAAKVASSKTQVGLEITQGTGQSGTRTSTR